MKNINIDISWYYYIVIYSNLALHSTSSHLSDKDKTVENQSGFWFTLRKFLGDVIKMFFVIVFIGTGVYVLKEYSFFSYGDLGVFISDEVLSRGYKTIYKNAVGTYWGIVLISSTLAVIFRVRYLKKKLKEEVIGKFRFSFWGYVFATIIATNAMLVTFDVMMGLTTGLCIGLLIAAISWISSYGE